MNFFACCRPPRSSSPELPNNPVISFKAVEYLPENPSAPNNPQLVLRRGAKYSAEALRNGVVRMKSERNLTSSRDISWRNGDIRDTRTRRLPPASWSRFPSHTRAERSLSSAGREDNVYSRDFAKDFQVTDSSDSKKNEDAKRSRSKSLKRSLKYIRTLDRGFRSSISVGGVLEYPELEILPSLETIPLVRRTASRDPVMPNSYSILSQPLEPGQHEAVDGARLWSRTYDDCLHRPGTADETSTRDNTSGFLRPEDASRHTRRSSDRQISPRSSTDMRHSTLDFQKFLEDYEVRAREKALQVADDSLERPESVN